MRKGCKLDLGGGGWFVLLSVLACAGVLLWHLGFLWQRGSARAIGDGKTVSSYGFDLSSVRVAPAALVASGMPKDGLRALVDPATMEAEEVERLRKERHQKFLVPDDRVIGVALGGQARAYPLRLLNWHEIANDRLAGRFLAVTYNPLCDSSVVFDRRVDGETLEFGVSGLLFNSNLIMYDRRPQGEGESLWSQLRAEAIAGPAARAGKTLRVVPSAVARWEDWRLRFPQTTVITGRVELADAYKRDPYVSYFGSQRLRFPVRPLPPAHPWKRKDAVLVVELNGQRVVLPLPLLARQVGPGGRLPVWVGGARVDIVYREWPPTAFVLAGEWPGLKTYQSFWFAWYAMHPEDRVWALSRG